MSYLFIIFLFIMSKIVLFIYLLSLSSYFHFIIFNHVSSPNETPFVPFYLYFIIILCIITPFFHQSSGTYPIRIQPRDSHYFIHLISPTRQGRVSMATMIRVMQSTICKPLSDLLAASGN